MNTLNSINEHLYTKMIKTNKKTFFFDIKQGEKGNKFLTIVKRKKGSTNVHDKSFILKSEDIDLFINALNEIKHILRVL